MGMGILTIKLRQGINSKAKVLKTKLNQPTPPPPTFVPSAFLISQFQKLSVDLIL